MPVAAAHTIRLDLDNNAMVQRLWARHLCDLERSAELSEHNGFQGHLTFVDVSRAKR